jgi:hypothetical protein
MMGVTQPKDISFQALGNGKVWVCDQNGRRDRLAPDWSAPVTDHEMWKKEYYLRFKEEAKRACKNNDWSFPQHSLSEESIEQYRRSAFKSLKKDYKKKSLKVAASSAS